MLTFCVMANKTSRPRAFARLVSAVYCLNVSTASNTLEHLEVNSFNFWHLQLKTKAWNLKLETYNQSRSQESWVLRSNNKKPNLWHNPWRHCDGDWSSKTLIDWGRAFKESSSLVEISVSEDFFPTNSLTSATSLVPNDVAMRTEQSCGRLLGLGSNPNPHTDTNFIWIKLN